MDIEVFEQLESIAKSDSNEERIMLRQFQKKDSYKELGTMNQKIVEWEKDEEILSTEDKKLSKELTRLENKKIELVRLLYKIDESYDIDDLNNTHNSLVMEKDKLKKQLKEDKEYKENLRPMYMEYHKKLATIDEEKILSDYEDYKELRKTLRELKNKLKLNESKTKSLKRHRDDLDKFEYDKDCEYCIKNGREQISEQDDIRIRLYTLDNEYSSLNANYKRTEYALEKLGDAEERNRQFHIFSDELNQVSHDAVKIGGKIDKNEATLKHTKSEITNIESNIHKYYESEEKIESNN